MEQCVTKRKAISILADELDSKRLVIFLGAGCSMTAGLPSWRDLIDHILQKYEIKTQETNLLRLASRLERELSSMKFREEVSNLLRSKPETTTLLHDELITLDVHLFVTTNYDHLLEDAFRKHGYSPRIVYRSEDLPSIDPTQKTIVKLHGDIDSPSSLVITSSDYTRYKTAHKGIVHWLQGTLSRDTIFFLGTSFDDLRLREVDDAVLNLFDTFRRSPFIVLKTPSIHIGDRNRHEIELSDFEALKEDFENRSFSVITIEDYKEIPELIRDIRTEAINRSIQRDPSDLKSRYLLQSDRLGALEQELTRLLDEKTLELCQSVREHGRLPTLRILMERVKNLVDHLENQKVALSLESQMEGWLMATDAILVSKKKTDILKARSYYENADKLFYKISDSEKWQKRLLRVRAKLFYTEGNIEKALDSVSDSEDPKTISMWLALLIDSGRMEEAYQYVASHPSHPAWISKSLYALVYQGYVEEAEKQFGKAIDEFQSLKNKGHLEKSPFGGEGFYEEICFAMANALFTRSFRLSGKQEEDSLVSAELSEEGRKSCRKALIFIDRIWDDLSPGGLETSYIASESLLMDMNIAFLLQDWERADKAASKLLTLHPVNKEAIRYILIRPNVFSSEFYRELANRLSDDYPDQSWAFTRIAFIHANFLNDVNLSWQVILKAMEIAHSFEDKQELANLISMSLT